MKRLLLWLLALVVVCAGGLLAAAASGALTRPAMHWLSSQLGRELAADGGLRIEIGRITRLSASNFRIANTAWGARPDMLTATTVVIELEAASLLKDTVVVRTVQLEGLDLSLERTAAGEHNWDFDLQDDDEASTSLPLVIERMSLPGAQISFTGPRLERPLELELATAEQHQIDGGMLDLVAQGEVNKRPLKLHMNIGPFASLVAGRDFSFAVEGELEDISLNADGHIDSLEKPVDTALSVRMKGPDAAYLAQELGIRNLGDGPFNLKAEIAPTPGGGGLRGTIAGDIGEFRLKAQGILAESAEPGNFAVQARIAGPDLSFVGGLGGVNGLPVVSFRSEFAVQRTGSALQIHSAELDLTDIHIAVQGRVGDLDDFSDSEISVQASGADFARVPGIAEQLRLVAGPFDVSGTVQRSKQGATSVQLSGTTTLAKFIVKGPVGDAPDWEATNVQLKLSGRDFAQLGKVLKLPYAPTGVFQASGGIEWSSKGLTLHDARLTVADQYLAIDGQFGAAFFARGGDARQFAGTDVRFDLHGEALEKLAGLVPDISLPRGPFSATGRLALSGKALSLSNMAVGIAGAKGSVSAELALPLSTGQASFEIDASGADISQLLPTLHDSSTAGQNFKLSTTGTRRGDQWSLQGLSFRTASGFISLQGNLLVSPEVSATGLGVEVHTENLRDVGKLIGRLWPEQPLELKGRFSGGASDFAIEKVSGQLGSTDFSGQASLHMGGKQLDMDIRLEAGVVDLADFLPKPAAKAKPDAPVKREGHDKKIRLIPEVELEYPDISGYTAKLTLKAQELRLRRQSYRNLALVAMVRDGRLSIDPMNFGGLDGKIDAILVLQPAGRKLNVQLAATGQNLALAPVPVNELGDKPTRYSVSLDLQGSGATLRELASSLNGHMQLVGRGGHILNSRLLATNSDFIGELLTTLNPMATRAVSTEVVCVAYLARAVNGIVTTDPALVMRTDEIDMISHGSVDLNTEKIDFNFKTSARQGLGFGVAQLINPYIKVNGTLARPGLTLDPKGTLVSGGTAFATGGLSIVATAAYDRVFRDKDPCGKAVAAATGHDQH
jgi:uncharacterized protein involved in outer membrane biogenesis